jgi:hypothetical protein
MMRLLKPEPKNCSKRPVPAGVGEALLRLLQTQEEQNRWLLENHGTVNAKIRTGIDQLDRGEGIPEDRLDAHLAKLAGKIHDFRNTKGLAMVQIR